VPQAPDLRGLVIDASLGVHLALGTRLRDPILVHWTAWLEERQTIWTPRLWLSEVTSAIHKTMMLKAVSKDRALSALEAVLDLPILLVDEDASLCKDAFNWATRMGQVAAYDGLYLALAERIHAELWTGDERLANNARQSGADWVHFIDS
jgi:predicted nucleic acid-binding protein